MAVACFVKVLFICCISSIVCFPQAQPRSNEKPRSQPTNNLLELDKLRNNPTSKTDSREVKKFALKKAISRKQRKLLLPDASEMSRYADFLQQPDTGLIKLFSDIGCEVNDSLLSVNEDCLNWIPMSGFYSFREKEYTRNFLSDIRLKEDTLITGGLLTQGILVGLGDIALDNLTLTSDGMAFLKHYKPESQSTEVSKQITQLLKGIKLGGYYYSNILPAGENMTYALRSVAYRGSYMGFYRGHQFDVLGGDERADITLVFRVLKRDEAGNLTLLWKILSRQPAPKMIFPKATKRIR